MPARRPPHRMASKVRGRMVVVAVDIRLSRLDMILSSREERNGGRALLQRPAPRSRTATRLPFEPRAQPDLARRLEDGECRVAAVEPPAVVGVLPAAERPLGEVVVVERVTAVGHVEDV